MELKARLRAVFDVLTLPQEASAKETHRFGSQCGFTQGEIDLADSVELAELDADE